MWRNVIRSNWTDNVGLMRATIEHGISFILRSQTVNYVEVGYDSNIEPVGLDNTS